MLSRHLALPLKEEILLQGLREAPCACPGRVQGRLEDHGSAAIIPALGRSDAVFSRN